MTVESTPDFRSDWALFLDVDGTLLDLTEHPDKVKLTPGLIDTLMLLHDKRRIPVALISGRSIALLDRLFSPLLLPIAGQHGAERRLADGRIIRHHIHNLSLTDVRESLNRIVNEHTGLYLEDKGLTLALHYRRVPNRKTEIENLVKNTIHHLGDNFVLVLGNMVLEIRPRSRDKGVVIAEFMEEQPFSGRIPVFIGDDVTDEDGFTCVNQLDGHSIKVGEGSTVARWRLANVSCVLVWLDQYAQWLGKKML
ncbi:MAG: trehalose-phosphatase [Gammaproteobacteria bacterium]|nr:trehalose-phosphatase [Gammaproteobacteria bacterium]